MTVRICSLSLICLLLSGLTICLAQGPSPQVGYVEQIKGNWTIVNKPLTGKIQGGDAWLMNYELKKDSPFDSGSISIVLFDGQMFRRSCSPQARCPGTVEVPELTELKNPEEQGLFASLAALFQKRKGINAIFAAARSVGENLEPNIAGLENGMLDLSAIVGKMPGAHRIRLKQQMPAVGEPIEVTVVVPPSRVQVSRLQPGLYSLEKITADGEETGSAVAVLIPSPSDRAAAQDFLEVALSVANRWRDADDSLKRSFVTRVLHAFQESRLH